jgi:zinc/manganese transport system substrate-binding protein
MWPFRGVFALSLVVGFAGVFPASAQQKNADDVRLVASFSILGDLAKNVGGDRVSVTSLVGPNGDVHVYTPSPADAKKISDARLVIINGLGLEGWMPRLVQSSGGKATVVTATSGITPRDLDGHADPHAWQAVPNVKTYVSNIRDALVAVDPAGADAYRSNARAYLAKLDALDSEVRAATAAIPANHRKVISTHNAFGYFAAAYGIEFIAPQGVSTDSEPSARDIAVIVTQLKFSKIPAVFLENISDPRLMRRIAAETGAKIGGTLYSDSLTDENGEAPTYIDMVRHNIKALTSALAM